VQSSYLKSKQSNLYNRTFSNHYFVIAISLCLIFILMGMLLQRIDREFDQAEQVNFEYRLAELKASVRLMEAALVSQGEMQLADKFEGANPMDWLDDKTTHYLGVMAPREAVNYPGNWFFEPINREISYVPVALRNENINYESVDKILRFKVRGLRSKEINSKFTGLVLSAVQTEVQTEVQTLD
jgi:hypothetical protein